MHPYITWQAPPGSPRGTMQPAPWPVRDSQIIERQSALLERIVADRARALARAAMAQFETSQGPQSLAAQPPRIRQIDLLTGEQWPASLCGEVPRLATAAANGPVRSRPHAMLPPLPRVTTRMPAAPNKEVGRTMSVPSWDPRALAVAPDGLSRSTAPESPLDAAPGDYLCPIRCVSYGVLCCVQNHGMVPCEPAPNPPR